MQSLKGRLCTKLLTKYKIILLPILAISFLLNIGLLLHMPALAVTQFRTAVLQTHLKNDASQADKFGNLRVQNRNFPKSLRAQPSRDAENFERSKNSNIDGIDKNTALKNKQRGSKQLQAISQYGIIGETVCPQMTIRAQEASFHNTSCRPHKPSENACRFTVNLFKIKPEIADCRDQRGPPYQLCRITEFRSGIRLSTPHVQCNLSSCHKDANIQLLIVDPFDGNYLVLDLPGTTSDSTMNDVVESAIVKTQENGFNFLFIDCFGVKYRENISQLLTFLPKEDIFRLKRKHFAHKVNVNLILLDSLSRPHFFRSLRKTVFYLRQKALDPSYKAHLLDFELFQSIHGHTHENEHALFGGKLYPENFTKSDKENAPTDLGALFGIFRDSGYQTMTQSDLCWKAWYGYLRSYMVDNWPELQQLMQKTIDTSGLTDASCKIIERLGKETIFTDDNSHQICFNGHHQHKYHFEYLVKYHKGVTRTRDAKHLFTFTETNVAHDNIGIRVQTVDNDLVDLIDSLAKLPNTFTMIYADHGNTYTDYQVSMHEGRLETYHPIMLGILPKKLGEKLGKDIVKNLKINQNRLLHLFDVRESLVELANYDSTKRMKPVGIFREIPKDRRCDDLKLSTPNYCICEEWDVHVENTTDRVALAEFAIGQLNNQLQKVILTSRTSEPTNHFLPLFGSCQRLRLQEIMNVRHRQTTKGTVITTIDVRLQSGNMVNQKEIMTVQVESSMTEKRSSFDMRLVTYTRISHFSIYEKCADKGIPVSLCICNKEDIPEKNINLQSLVGYKTEIEKLTPCLLLLKRSYSENSDQEDFVAAKVYELANICSEKTFEVTLAAITESVQTSTELPLTIKLPPKTIYFATIMMTEVGFMKTRLRPKLSISSDQHGLRERK